LGLDYVSKKRVAHIGLIVRERKLLFYTVEFNTN
jgi:hypothetical protein